MLGRAFGVVPAGARTHVAGTTSPFPLAASANGRYLVNASGTPFPLLGRTLWGLMGLNDADRETMLLDAYNKGFTMIEFSPPQRDTRAANAPRDGDTNLPFTTALAGGAWDGTSTPDFSTPNAPYWDNVVQLVARCQQLGIFLLVAPAYSGYSGTGSSQGWQSAKNSNGSSKMATYGAYVSGRLAAYDNIAWLIGGDYGAGGFEFTAPEAAVEAALLGALQTDKTRLVTQEWDSDTIGQDSSDFGDDITLSGAYSFGGDIATQGRRAYAESPAVPAYQQETGFDEEGPADLNYNDNIDAPYRRYNFRGWLASIGGYNAGNGYLWTLNDWQDHLSSQCQQDLARLNAFIKSIAWWKLVPSGLGGIGTLVTVGAGTVDSDSSVQAAASPDGDLIVAYWGIDKTGTATFDMTKMSGNWTAQWWNPISGATSSAGTGTNSGSHVFTSPGNNGDGLGSNDWLLKIVLQ